MIDPSPFPPETGRKLTAAEELVVQSFARLHKVALGIAVGVSTGLVIWAATAILLVKGGSHVGPTLGLLSQYFIGYSVSWQGSLVGLLYGFAFGFIVGWLLALLRNLFIAIYLQAVKLRANLSTFSDFLE